MSADEILDALDPEQRAVARAVTGPVCVLAGAGTGKTRAITHRIAYGVRTGAYNPSSVLAVTFTARAAGEMRSRLRTLGVPGVQARTFHSAALRQLRYFWPRVVGGPPPRLVEHKAQVVAEVASRLGVEVDRLTVRDLASEIEWAKVSMVPPDDYPRAAEAAGRVPPAGTDAATVARVLRAYEDAKDVRGVLDFEDVLVLLGGMLAERHDVADEVRSRYRHLVVDEYQDVSPAQQFLLDQWLGARHELCVVGDPSQTIYSFTGATPYHLLSFAERHPGTTVVRLVRDYRSTPEVVHLANRLLSGGPRRSREAGALELVAQRPSGPPVGFTVYDDDEDEARGVARRVARLVAAGTPPREIAVLFRTNAQSEAFEQALAEAGIGYLVHGGERFFARPEVRDALVLLRGSARAPVEAPLGETVRGVLSSAGWTPDPPAPRGAQRERWDALEAIVALADELAATRGATTTAELVAELDERAAAQHAPAVDGVTLASLHAAKGLEWDAVFLAGLSEGLLPVSLAETPAAVAEERRLLYVGITRARVHLELSWARARHPGSRATRSRSRFLEHVWPAGDGRRRRGTAVGVVVGDPDEALVATLRTWRDAESVRSGLPPRAVLPDPTLERLAVARPTTTRELAAVDGVGPMTLQRYGDELVRLLAAGSRATTRPGSR